MDYKLQLSIKEIPIEDQQKQENLNEVRALGIPWNISQDKLIMTFDGCRVII